MLGKHHISITFATLLPFILPLFFQIEDLVIPLTFLIAAIIGSLTPDADCGGKSTLHYKFTFVDILMKTIIIKPVVFVFQILYRKNKFNMASEVKEEHRGIMHSPIGILISSVLLTFVALVFMLLTSIKEWWVLLALFLGLVTGQFLHLLEDSCTVSGINWKFPFGFKEVKGRIYTFNKEEDKRDIRPIIFQYFLSLLSILLFILYLFEKVTISLWLVYPLVLVSVVFSWVLIILLSQSNWGFWYQNVEVAKKINKIGKFRKPQHNQYEINNNFQNSFSNNRRGKKNKPFDGFQL